MNLEFEIKGQILKRIDSHDVMNHNYNVYKCRFTFEEDSEWIDVNKFVIFKDGWGNSTTVHLGKSSNILSCLVPDKVLAGSYFKVSVYGGDLITTNNVSIALLQSGYSKNRHHGCDKQKDIFVEIFDRLDNSVDSIVYNENTLHLFCRDSLLESIYLPFLDENEITELVSSLVSDHIQETIPLADESNSGLMSVEDKIKLDSIEDGATKTIVDTRLNADSDNAVSNRVVVEALNGKEDSYNFVERIDDLLIELINNGE